MTAPQLVLDHVAVICRNLDQTHARYADLGFTLTERSSHRGPVPPDQHIEPWGTGNHCAMFRHGYLELLGITDASRFHAHLTRRLEHYEGLHLIAFGTDAMEPDVRWMRQRGAPLGDPIALSRDVPIENGTRRAGFAIAYFDEHAWPEADFILIQHRDPGTLWQPRLLEHANGAHALTSVTVCVADAGAFTRRLEQALGPAQGHGFALGAGRLEAIEPATVPERFPGVTAIPAPPRVMAVGVAVDDLQRTAALPGVRRCARFADATRLVCIVGDDDRGVIVEFTHRN